MARISEVRRVVAAFPGGLAAVRSLVFSVTATRTQFCTMLRDLDKLLKLS